MMNTPLQGYDHKTFATSKFTYTSKQNVFRYWYLLKENIDQFDTLLKIERSCQMFLTALNTKMILKEEKLV